MLQKTNENIETTFENLFLKKIEYLIKRKKRKKVFKNIYKQVLTFQFTIMHVLTLSCPFISQAKYEKTQENRTPFL